MARRVESPMFRRKAIIAPTILVFLLFALLLPSCRNPLMRVIDSSGITVRVDGAEVELGELYQLGRVKRGSIYTVTFTVQNSGNTRLLLTGEPLVRIVGDAETTTMFSITEQPADQVDVRGSTSFTLRFLPVGGDVNRQIQVVIENNSRSEEFTFELVAFVDGTPPAVKLVNTVPQVSPANVATGVSTDKVVWVEFSEAMDPATITAGSFTLTKDGTLDTVEASVTYNTSTRIAYLDPLSLLEDGTLYRAAVLATVADLVGNAMVLPFEWSFTTGTGIIDTEPPQVVSTLPADDATGVALSSAISVTFTEPIDHDTATGANFLITGGASAVTGTVTHISGSSTITFTPDAPGLASLTTYRAQLTTGIRDEAGNPLTSVYEWSFTTEMGEDTTGPTVVGRNPTPGADPVPINTVVTAEFNELIDPLTINGSTFNLVAVSGDSPGAVSGAVGYNAYSKTATFAPSSTLDDLAQFRATLTTGITDISGNRMAAQVQWFFTTGDTPDSTSPTVSSTSPANGGTGALLYGNITSTFSESMNPASLSTSTFKLFKGADPVVGTVGYSEATKTATFDPAPLLQETTVYTARVIGGVDGAKDAAGNPLAADVVWTFTTEAGTTNPVVVTATLNPASGAAGVPIDTSIRIEFSKMMNAGTINATNLLVSKNAGGSVAPVTITYDDVTRVAEFTPSADLEYSTVYRVDCTADIKDIGGNGLVPHSYLFTTMANNLWDYMVWDVGTWAP